MEAYGQLTDRMGFKLLHEKIIFQNKGNLFSSFQEFPRPISSGMNQRHAGEFLVIGIPGATVDPSTQSLIQEIQPGGFILFGRNIKSPQQLRDLIDHLRSLVPFEPVITIDQEGGRVSRLKEIGSEPPSIKQLRDRGETSLFQKHGELTGKLLRLFGFNLNLCPVLDVSFDDEADNSLKNRTFGKNPEQVILFASFFAQAMRKEGILSCGKHFPGYSAAGVDPHHELPTIPRTRAELENCEWIPYRKLQQDLDSIMIGHARYLDLDPSGTASSLSSLIIRKILHDEWKFNGCVISDDMDMGAILNEYGFDEAFQKALEAGNDLILLCHRTEKAVDARRALEKVSEPIKQVAWSRIDQFRAKLAAPAPFSIEAWKSLDQQVMDLRAATLGADQAHTRSADDGKRSPVEVY